MSISFVAAEAITIVPIMVLAVAVVTSVVDRLREQGDLLERARDAALEASRLKSAFIANVSHEIRTPLNIITGYNELIEEHLAERNDESVKEYVEGIQRASARLLRTIGNILDISKIERGAFSLAPTRLEIVCWSAFWWISASRRSVQIAVGNFKAGLGLVLTRNYLELNGAKISVQTEKGKGTTFAIHFCRRAKLEPLASVIPRA